MKHLLFAISGTDMRYTAARMPWTGSTQRGPRFVVSYVTSPCSVLMFRVIRPGTVSECTVQKGIDCPRLLRIIPRFWNERCSFPPSQIPESSGFAVLSPFAACPGLTCGVVLPAEPQLLQQRSAGMVTAIARNTKPESEPEAARGCIVAVAGENLHSLHLSHPHDRPRAKPTRSVSLLCEHLVRCPVLTKRMVPPGGETALADPFFCTEMDGIKMQTSILQSPGPTNPPISNA